MGLRGDIPENCRTIGRTVRIHTLDRSLASDQMQLVLRSTHLLNPSIVVITDRRELVAQLF